MTWRPGWTKRDDEAETRLRELAERQEQVHREMVKMRRENGFIRMVRQAMGPAQ